MDSLSQRNFREDDQGVVERYNCDTGGISSIVRPGLVHLAKSAPLSAMSQLLPRVHMCTWRWPA